MENLKFNCHKETLLSITLESTPLPNKSNSTNSSEVKLICPNAPVISKIKLDKKVLRFSNVIKNKSSSGSLNFDDLNYQDRIENSGENDVIFPGTGITLARLSDLHGLSDSSKTVVANCSKSILNLNNKRFYIVNCKPDPYKGEYLRLSDGEYFLYYNKSLDIFGGYDEKTNDLFSPGNINNSNSNNHETSHQLPILRILRRFSENEEMSEDEIDVSLETNNTSASEEENDFSM